MKYLRTNPLFAAPKCIAELQNHPVFLVLIVLVKLGISHCVGWKDYRLKIPVAAGVLVLWCRSSVSMVQLLTSEWGSAGVESLAAATTQHSSSTTDCSQQHSPAPAIPTSHTTTVRHNNNNNNCHTAVTGSAATTAALQQWVSVKTIFACEVVRVWGAGHSCWLQIQLLIKISTELTTQLQYLNHKTEQMNALTWTCQISRRCQTMLVADENTPSSRFQNPFLPMFPQLFKYETILLKCVEYYRVF